jgi:hypothetical protein
MRHGRRTLSDTGVLALGSLVLALALARKRARRR